MGAAHGVAHRSCETLGFASGQSSRGQEQHCQKTRELAKTHYHATFLLVRIHTLLGSFPGWKGFQIRVSDDGCPCPASINQQGGPSGLRKTASVRSGG